MSALTSAPPVFGQEWLDGLQNRLREANAQRKANSRKRTDKRDIWTLDCETDPFEVGVIPEPFLWGLYNGGADEYHQFETAAEVADFISDKEILIYAHNGGKFDYHYMKPFFNSDQPLMVIGGRIARFKIGDAELRDSTNLLPVPLSAFQKEKVDYNIFKRHLRNIPANRKIIELYLQSDCVNLYNFIREFVIRYGSHLTQAGASMKYWSKKYNVQIPRQSAQRYGELKPFYYGGRVQCFANGYRETPFKVLDINSAYPYAMTFKHPYSVGGTSSRQLPKEREKLETALIRLTAVSKGAVPLRADTGGLYFPSDERRGREYFITGWEYLAGLETDTLKPVRIKEVITFDELISFGDYVTEFYEQRKVAKAAGDKASDIFAKIFLNSLYGKFAANPENYSEYVITEADSEKLPKYLSDGYSIGPEWDEARHLLTRPLMESRRRHYNIATAASITGFVRAYLWRALCQCSDVIYCDTDSIAARDTGRLQCGNDLGQWKIEMRCDRYAIAGKKLYAFHSAEKDEWKTASKGAKLTAEEICRVASGGRVNYQPEIPTYSALSSPHFTPREIVSTYRNISQFPGPLAKDRKAA